MHGNPKLSRCANTCKYIYLYVFVYTSIYINNTIHLGNAYGCMVAVYLRQKCDIQNVKSPVTIKIQLCIISTFTHDCRKIINIYIKNVYVEI